MSNPRYAFLKLDAPIMPLVRMGTPDLTSEDVLLACGGLPRSRFLYSVVVWVGDNKDLPELTRLALMEAVGLEEVRKAHARLEHKKGALQDMIILALNERQTSHTCKTCNGRKEIVIDHKVITCETCNGSGLSPRNKQPKQWRQIYDSIYHMFGDWEREICHWVGLRMGC